MTKDARPVRLLMSGQHQPPDFPDRHSCPHCLLCCRLQRLVVFGHETCSLSAMGLRVRTIAVLGYWELGDICIYRVISVSGDIFLAVTPNAI